MTETAYLAPRGLEDRLERELNHITQRFGRLFLASGPKQDVFWAQNIWLDPVLISFHSISDAAKKLRALQGLWSFYPERLVRKGALITAQLPRFAPKPIIFPATLPKSPLGSWMLVDETQMLASSHCTSPFSQGEVLFQESKIPPSRAYLKLWEALTRINRWPEPKDLCLDLGASPGSWSWALLELGASVIAVDRAPLLIQSPHLTALERDAFSVQPSDFPEVRWLFCDVICYPQKLYDYLQVWLDLPVHLVCTLKFQGPEDLGVIHKFANIKNSSLFHLFNNKHELTFIRTV